MSYAYYDVTIETLAQDGVWEAKSASEVERAGLPDETLMEIFSQRYARPGSYDHQTGHMVGKTIVSSIRRGKEIAAS